MFDYSFKYFDLRKKTNYIELMHPSFQMVFNVSHDQQKVAR